MCIPRVPAGPVHIAITSCTCRAMLSRPASLIHIDLTPLSLKVSLVDALGHSNRFTDVYRALFQDHCLNCDGYYFIHSDFGFLPP